MDVKTLSAMLGHVSAATTLDIYTHITNPMRSEAAAKIDQKIGKAAPQELPAEPQEKRTMTTFQPYAGRKRKPGTGCITQISENCWEGRYSPMWPDGKKHSRNVYAKTREECEALLPGLIEQMKAEIPHGNILYRIKVARNQEDVMADFLERLELENPDFDNLPEEEEDFEEEDDESGDGQE